jgi:hypothetical protein
MQHASQDLNRNQKKLNRIEGNGIKKIKILLKNKWGFF